MDQFDLQRKEANRQYQSERNKERFVSPSVSSIGDIQRVLAQLDPGSRLNQNVGEIQISASVRGNNADNQSMVFNVVAKSSEQSYRDILLRGFKLLKQRREMSDTAKPEVEPTIINDKRMNPPTVIESDTLLSIDPIIERLLGARREGELICWDLNDGHTYKYDIFAHRLTRVKRDAEGDNNGLSSLS